VVVRDATLQRSVVLVMGGVGIAAPPPAAAPAPAVSHSCAWIGSPCLRQCGHGASIRQPYGAGGGGGGRLLVCGGSATFSTRRSHLPAVPRVSLKRLLD
jgi:hypothetical protein